ncbi:MAG: TolC family protein, partial [Myxococcales bacterium]|nr:TolC family protein [Myxococcales bacterium]
MKPLSYSHAALVALSIGSSLSICAPVAAQTPPVAAPAASAATRTSSADDLERRLRGLIARPGGLTARQASAKAIATSNELKQSEAEVRSAAAEKDQAAVGYIPRVTLTARYTRLSEIDSASLGTLVGTTQAGPIAPGQPLIGVNVSFPQILNQYLLQANVTVPLTDYFLRTNHTNRAASHSLRAARYRQEVSKRSAALQAQLAYYAWAQSALANVVAEQTLEQAPAHSQVPAP